MLLLFAFLYDSRIYYTSYTRGNCLCAIGMERQMRGKGAGLRTHVLIGMGSALFMIVSKYGFADVLSLDHVGLDPSRIAAQVVTGVGFIGAGNILG